MSRQPIYPSRLSPKPSLSERQDPVVYGDGPLPAGLTEEQAQFYEEQGYLAIEGLFSPQEVEVLTQELEFLTSSKKIRETEKSITEGDSNLVRSIFQVHQFSPLFDQLSRDKRILDIVGHLLGGEVYIHQSRINLKLPFLGRGFNWHSDFETWHIEDGMPRMRALSVAISLTDNYEFKEKQALSSSSIAIRYTHQPIRKNSPRRSGPHGHAAVTERSYGPRLRPKGFITFSV